MDIWALCPVTAPAADLKAAFADLQNNNEDEIHSAVWQNAVSAGNLSCLGILGMKQQLLEPAAFAPRAMWC